MNPVSPQGKPELYDACVETAISEGEMLMQRLVTRSVKSMHERAGFTQNTEEKKWLIEAGMFLPRHQDTLCKLYPEMLRNEFQAASEDEVKPARGLSFDSLELMGEDQVDETVEIVRAQQTVLAAVEFELAQLNGLVSSARGLSVVRTSVNPLRPEAWVRALRNATLRCPVPSGVRNRWMHHLGEALGQELAPVYLRLCDLLKGQGIASAAFGVNQSSARGSAGYETRAAHQLGSGLPGAVAGAVPGASGASPAQGGQPPGVGAVVPPGAAGSGDFPILPGGAAPSVPAGADTQAHAATAASPLTPAATEHRLNLRELRRLLKGQPVEAPGPSRWPSLDPRALSGRDTHSGSIGGPDSDDAGLTVPAAFEALQEMEQVDQVVRRLKQGRPLSSAELGFDAMLAARPEGTELTPAQALSIEVVKLMLDNVVADVRLLPAVRDAVRDLEPSLLRLSVNDPRFFSDKKHPARLLLERMTQRSLAWTSEESPEFQAFMQPLREAIEALGAIPIESAEPFDFALRTLEEAWGELEERERKRRGQAARALMKAEQRNMLAEKVVDELRARPDVAAAPNEIVRFLVGPWAQVLAAARLAEKDSDSAPDRYMAVINDLIWSAQPRLASTNPARLTMLVPRILTVLRQGLASIEYPEEASGRFMDYLADTHEMALRVAGVRSGGTPRMPAAQEDAGAEPAPVPSGDMWLAPGEALATGLMDLPDEDRDHQPFAPTRPAGLDEDAAPDRVADFDDAQSSLPPPGMHPGDLQPGTWVDLRVEGQWIRCQLAWASPHSMLFMFTTSAGRSLSMTRRMLERMMGDGSLLIVAEQTVVDGALDAVAQTALRNSLDVKE